MGVVNLYKNVFIGENYPVYIIAEIGSNHNQSLELAKESILAAKESGADAVKFQSINVNELYYKPLKSTINLHKKIDFDEKWHFILKKFCDTHSIAFFSSPTYLKAIDILEGINVVCYKLASAQIGTFPQLVKKVAETGKPVFLSTGIVLRKELDRVIDIFKNAGNNKYILLHCNSIYPTPYEKVHLNLITSYKKQYNCVVGFSDHTIGTHVPGFAVSRGARIIEKHFTLDKTLPVPDATFSLNPEEFKQMVAQIRIAEKVTISGQRKSLEKEENSFKESILYKLVLNKNIGKNETLNVSDFLYKRHPGGIDCRKINEIVGKKINSDLQKGDLLETKHLKTDEN